MMDGVTVIEAMSRKEFRKKMVKGVAKTPEFSQLMSSGIETMTATEKNWLRINLNKAGVGFKYTGTDNELRCVAFAIANRAGEVR